MLIKEYRIPLPLTVEEYKVAQLYMIAKKSREESQGAGSGVEILVNEPYEDGPGGNGQYTHKIYHIGNHLPSWFKALLPKSVLTVEEEAWNAYPYTKTRYTCPFVEKFSLEIETKYFDDIGNQDNVFSLSNSDIRNRTVDLIDVVNDQLYGSEYKREEDPRLYVSQKTERGPLEENWLETYNGPIMMCAYKLCKVEFKYWGMQSKIEKFIHDTALRKTMLRAHRQAWAWQDEWHGLTMEDIRQLEKETQEALSKKMCAEDAESLTEEEKLEHKANTGNTQEVDWNAIDKDNDICVNDDVPTKQRTASPHSSSLSKPCSLPLTHQIEGKPWSRSNSRTALYSPSGSNTFDLQAANWRMESIVRNSDSSSNDEFFDAEDEVAIGPIPRWSSMEGINMEDDSDSLTQDDSIFSASHIRKVQREQGKISLQTGSSIDATSLPATPTSSPAHQACSTTVLIFVLHSGSVLDSGLEPIGNKKSDMTTFKTSFENVMKLHYPSMMGHVTFRLISCPAVCSEALAVLTNLSPYSFQASPSALDGACHSFDAIPIGSLPLFAVSCPEYQENVSRIVATLNQNYNDFIHSEEGMGFNGQVVMIGDSIGSMLGYDVLCRSGQYSSRFGSENSINENPEPPASPGLLPRSNPLISISDGSEEAEELKNKCHPRTYRKSYSHPQDSDSTFHEALSLLSAPPLRRRSSGSSDHSNHYRLDFEVSDYFMLGSPLGTVLAYRKMLSFEDKNTPPSRPLSNQVYNLFHPSDPCTSRLEPLLSARFGQLSPVNIPRYQKYPLGDGQPIHLLEYIQTFAHMFVEGVPIPSSAGRRTSETSISSTVSGLVDALPISAITSITQKWWGTKRIDYALYCPEGLSNFPPHSLPHLFHASFWESSDVIAFILRQITRSENLILPGDAEKGTQSTFIPSQPREKWNKKRTSVKLKNMTANHRTNDVIVKDGSPQVLTARFVYGPLDMVALTGEKVDIHIIKEIRTGEWNLLSTEVTDKNGRIIYVIPKEKTLGFGMFPCKMVVRGDHTSVDFFLTVVPPQTECVVFSIDGSFTASMSVTGRDPKVRAGAVDIVRHWQELGFLIIYITGRPDMQKKRVVSWLAQHNFPHGLVSFADGLSTDPLRHKADYLRHLQRDADITIHVAYGSSKDIWVYSSIGVTPSNIFIVGKTSKKQNIMATILNEGYASHLSDLKAPGGSRPAQGNARMILPRGCFGLPGQGPGLIRQRRSAKRTTSYPLSNQSNELRNLSQKGPSSSSSDKV